MYIQDCPAKIGTVGEYVLYEPPREEQPPKNDKSVVLKVSFLGRFYCIDTS